MFGHQHSKNKLLLWTSVQVLAKLELLGSDLLFLVLWWVDGG